MREWFHLIVGVVLAPIYFIAFIVWGGLFSLWLGVRILLWNFHLVKDIEPGRPHVWIQNGKVIHRSPIGAILSVLCLVVMICLVVGWL